MALARISENLTDLRGTDDFHGEARSLWVTEVLPAVQEIEDSVRTNKYLYQRADHLLTRPDGIIAGGGLIVGAMTAPELPSLIASAAATMLPAARALWESRKANAIVRQNQFYFIYSLNRRLG